MLISDIEMPNEDGYSLIRTVRALKDAEIGRIPACCANGARRSGRPYTSPFRRLSVAHTKPVEPAELVLAISNLTSGVKKLKRSAEG